MHSYVVAFWVAAAIFAGAAVVCGLVLRPGVLSPGDAACPGRGVTPRDVPVADARMKRRRDGMSSDRARLVTVSASYGAGGSVVAPALAQRLGVPFLQRATTSTGGRGSGPGRASSG